MRFNPAALVGDWDSKITLKNFDKSKHKLVTFNIPYGQGFAETLQLTELATGVSFGDGHDKFNAARTTVVVTAWCQPSLITPEKHIRQYCLDRDPIKGLITPN